MSHQHRTLGDTVYFWFAANDTAGSGNDGSTPVFDVRLAGATAGAAPVLSGSATLLSHANYPNGCHEIAVAATSGNGFSADNTYAVFCTLLVDSQNPSGFVGSFSLEPIISNVSDKTGFSLATAPPTAAQIRSEIDTNSTQLSAIVNYVDELETRLTAVRAGLLDNLSNLDAAISSRSTHDAAAVRTAIEAAGTHLALIKAVTDVLPDSGALTTLITHLTDLKGTGFVKDTHSLTDILADVTGLNGASMRGTDGANTTVPDAAGTAASLHATTDALISALNDLDSTAVQAACAAALVAIHLDHLLAEDYDPAGKPGIATALLNELIENDGGISRFTANSLEQAPAGGGGSGLSGSNTVTITIDDGTNPLPGAKVDIWNSDASTFLQAYLSDSNGQVSFTADPGSYKVKLLKAGYSFNATEDLVVDENPETAGYSGSTISIPGPSSPDLCRVYEYLFDQAGDPVTEINSESEITNLPYTDDAAAYTGEETVGVYDSVTGLIYWDIVRGAKVIVRIPEFGIEKTITVPDQGTARLTTL